MRLATWNVEWFNALFDDEGRVMADDQPSARYNTSRAQQLAGLRAAFRAMDADGILIVEGPDSNGRRSTVTALQAFAAWAGIRARRAVHGFASDSEQEIGFLYDPDRLSVQHDPQGPPAPDRMPAARRAHGAPRFDTAYRYDLDADGVSEVIRFSKPPLELAVAWPGRAVRLIGVHAKSKAPHGRVSKAEFSRISIDNRRKQLAQCLWIRARAVEHLDHGDALIVLGDFNDGPGLDEHERLFGRSGVEIVLGAEGMRLFDPHADMALHSRVGLTPTTARFWLAPAKRYFEALLDFIMVSPDLVPGAAWRIWHPFNDPEIGPDLRDALLSASDHFPVTLDLAD